MSSESPTKQSLSLEKFVIENQVVVPPKKRQSGDMLRARAKSNEFLSVEVAKKPTSDVESNIISKVLDAVDITPQRSAQEEINGGAR